MNESSSNLSHNPHEAARRVTAAEAREASELEVEAELRALIESDETRRDAIYADAMTTVARGRARDNKDPSIWTPHGARTALGIASLLMTNADVVEDNSAFAPMTEAEAKAEIDKRRRTGPVFRALAAIRDTNATRSAPTPIEDP